MFTHELQWKNQTRKKANSCYPLALWTHSFASCSLMFSSHSEHLTRVLVAQSLSAQMLVDSIFVLASHHDNSENYELESLTSLPRSTIHSGNVYSNFLFKCKFIRIQDCLDSNITWNRCIPLFFYWWDLTLHIIFKIPSTQSNTLNSIDEIFSIWMSYLKIFDYKRLWII